MGRLPGGIIVNVVSHLAAEGSSHDSDDDKDNGDSSPAHAHAHAFTLAPYAAVSRWWQTQDVQGVFHGAVRVAGMTVDMSPMMRASSSNSSWPTMRHYISNSHAINQTPRRMPALRKMSFALDPPVWRGNGRLEVEDTAMEGTARGGTPSAPPGDGGGRTAEAACRAPPRVLPGRGGRASLEGGRGGTFGCRVWACGRGQGAYGVMTVSGV